METDLLEQRLDQALEATFPASDPIAVTLDQERNIYSVSPGEPPILVRAAVHMYEHVLLIDDEFYDPFALVAAKTEGRAYEIGAPLFMAD